MKTASIRLTGAGVVAAMLALAAPAFAQNNAARPPADTHHHAHDHDHDHAHDSAAPDQARIYKGYFRDDQIAARGLDDWQGDWQSVYPLLLAGDLDPVMRHKAAQDGKSARDHHSYYKTGYRTDVDRITIKGERVTFHRAGGAVSGDYAGDGFEVLTYEKGNRGVRFVFRKRAGDVGAPSFIQFSDHRIAPEKSDHYHLYWGEDRAALLSELTNWPTYYPATLTADAIVTEMTGH